MAKISILLLASMMASSSFALVDYSEPSAPETRPAPRAAEKATRATPRASSSSSSSSSSANYGVEMRVGYESLTAKDAEGKPQASLWRGSFHLQTPYNIYFDANTAYAKTDDAQMSDKTSGQMMNPEFSMGINWVKFGSGADLGSLDLIVGHRHALRDSDFASSRNDYSLSLETKKRLMDFALGLGAQYTFTGKAKDSNEMDVGNIVHFYGEIGYQATYDIIFGFAAGHYSISEGEQDASATLDHKLTSSYYSPKLNLILSPHVAMELGGIFMGKKASGAADMLKQGLYHVKGLYGDSLYLNLAFAL